MLNQHSKNIAEITLERPEVHNALNAALLEQLENSVKEVSQMKDARVLVIRGAGDKAFSAGADLKERAHMSLDQTREFIHHLNRVFDAVEGLEIPTIAFINGIAFGGGLELALACDMRVIAPHAQVGLTECSLGIIPGAGGTQRLPRVIGYSRAAEMIFSARKLNAADALAMGLVNSISDSPKGFAEQIVRCSGNSLRLAKKAMKTGQEFKAYEGVLEHPDRLEGLAAFKEKRTAHFKP
jgi:enoyl-CoA hydratase/carnithine racemase